MKKQKAVNGEAREPVITKEVLQRAMETLRRYRAGKTRLDARIVENEQWWKLRHWDYVREQGNGAIQTKSAWLVNVLLSKHADAVDAVPEPNCLPREQADEEEARRLSAIVPVVLQQNDFEQVWSDNWWKKLKAGFAIYGVFWDAAKHGGLGDIAIRRVDPLKLFWEPGITGLQDSRNLFYVELIDNELLEAQWPQLCGKLGGAAFTTRQYLYDDSVDLSGKTPVVDWYYKKRVGGRTVLHYVKFVGESVLYATEDDAALSGNGLYDHGMYPFFADVLFPEEGTPAGFGYIDLCKDPQRQIDLLNSAIVANCLAAATPRWLKRGDDGVNEQEYADWSRPFVHVQGSLEENVLRPIQVAPLSGNYLNLLGMKIDEMKETVGNRDVSNGGISAGVTAASAIAALQEQSGKLSRDQISASYRCFRQIVYCVIELIRQFYTLPRQFRITGADEAAAYVSYDNAALQPQRTALGETAWLRMPVFDIEVSAQKQSSYSKLSSNEMALQFFRMGFFEPGMAGQALAALEMMEFKGKDAMRRRIEAAAPGGGDGRGLASLGQIDGGDGLPRRFAPRNDRGDGLPRRSAPRNDGGDGLPRRSAPRNDRGDGLPRRFAPRNDRGGSAANQAPLLRGTDPFGTLLKSNQIVEKARAAAAKTSQPR